MQFKKTESFLQKNGVFSMFFFILTSTIEISVETYKNIKILTNSSFKLVSKIDVLC